MSSPAASPAGWSSFSDYDIYADSGASGIDTIAAVGRGNASISASTVRPDLGIEVIDATLATGKVRVVGDWEATSSISPASPSGARSPSMPAAATTR